MQSVAGYEVCYGRKRDYGIDRCLRLCSGPKSELSSSRVPDHDRRTILEQRPSEPASSEHVRSHLRPDPGFARFDAAVFDVADVPSQIGDM